MKTVITSMLFLVALIACNPHRASRLSEAPSPIYVWEEGKTERFNQNTVVSHNPLHPMRYQVTDASCTADTALKDMGKVSVWLFEDEAKKKIDFDFTGISGDSLKNSFNLGTYKDFYFRDEYFDCQQQGKTSNYSCARFEKTIVREAQPIYFCQQSYPDGSVENAALASMAGVLLTAKFYRLATQAPWSTKLDLLIFPKFERILHLVDGRSLVSEDTDNARWSNLARQNSLFSIEVLPHSEERKNYFSKAFWLQLGVASHEFGHHLFFHLIRNISASRLAAQGELRAYQTVFFQSPPFGRVVDTNTVIDAINEGFADLIAHYTFNSGLNPVGGIQLGTFKISRYIASSVSDDQKEKTLSASVLKHFFNTVRTFPNNDKTPDHQDIHTVGTLIAHGLDAVFAEQLGTTPQNPLSERKANLIREWIATTDELYARAQRGETGIGIRVDPQGFLEDSVFVGIKLVLGADNKLKQKACDVLAAKFPVYAANWKNRYTCQ